MSIEVKVPVLPESVSDATVATWHKKAGDTVRRDENLVDLETDKVVLEVPAPADGTLKEIKKESGDTVTNEEVLGLIEEGEVSDESEEDSSEEKDQDEADESGDEGKDEDSESGREEKDADDESGSDKKAKKSSESGDSGADDSELGPAVRKLVAENDLDPSQIKGTGRGGRITKEDVLRHMKEGKSKPATAPKEASSPAVPVGQRSEERVPMSRLRQRIAERMVEAQNTAAMLTSFNEVNLRAVMDIRKRYKESFQNEHGVKLGFMSFFVKACCEALKKHPIVNASVDDGDIVYHGYQDVGIAVSTDRGLVVPVLRDADQMSLAEIEKGIADYASKAREGSIKLDDLQGGTFTITNGGVFGSLISTPILNMPQSAILGMHTIKERPIVENGEIVAAPMMYIALTYDHRIIDGKDAVLFLVAVKDALEDPTRLLLNL